MASLAAVPKQYMCVSGHPVLMHSLRALCADPRIQCLIVVIAEDDQHFQPLIAAHWQADWPPLVTVIGGSERAESVYAGLSYARQAGFTCVAVHDAARPGLRAEQLRAVLDAGCQHADGALLALPCSDTVKQSDPRQCSQQTLDRRQLWLAQTPQVFATERLWQAWSQLSPTQFNQMTDEASVIEAVGGAPRLVLGHPSNMKITHAGDPELAAWWLAQAPSATIGKEDE